MTGDLDGLLAPGVIGRLQRGEVRSSELVEACLAQIEAHQPALKPFVTVTADRARAEAAAADEALARGQRLGPLHGLPLTLKDNIDTAGLRTTAGSAFLGDNVPAQDATVARRVREAGAVLLGKVQLHEFAFGGTTQNPHYGPCRNPWDAERIPGGSSGGSGSAVAAGMCALSLGTDTGGSVRIPGALNGVTGLRPTLGRVSNLGVFPVTWSFDTVGPLARGVEDVAIALGAISGFDVPDGLSVDRPVPDFCAGLGQGVDGLRIGLPRSFYFEECDPEVASAVRAALDVLVGLGAELVEVDLPGAADAVVACTRIIWAEARAQHEQRYAEEKHRFGEDLQRRLALADGVSSMDYARAVEASRHWRREVELAFRQVDVIASPTSGTVAPLAARAEMIETTVRLTRFTYGWSLAGLPAISLPCGVGEAGMPVGLQLAGRPFEEDVLLRAGAAYQAETDWHARAPALAG